MTPEDAYNLYLSTNAMLQVANQKLEDLFQTVTKTHDRLIDMSIKSMNEGGKRGIKRSLECKKLADELFYSVFPMVQQ
jgi:hypothetical protein